MQIEFSGEVIHWRGPAPYYFVRLPASASAEIARIARTVSYGWGAIPVGALIEGQGFTTSLFPKDGGYLLPLKDAVRRHLSIGPDGRVAVRLAIGPGQAGIR